MKIDFVVESVSKQVEGSGIEITSKHVDLDSNKFKGNPYIYARLYEDDMMVWSGFYRSKSYLDSVDKDYIKRNIILFLNKNRISTQDFLEIVNELFML